MTRSIKSAICITACRTDSRRRHSVNSVRSRQWLILRDSWLVVLSVTNLYVRCYGKSSQCHQSRFFLWRCSLHGPLQIHWKMSGNNIIKLLLLGSSIVVSGRVALFEDNLSALHCQMMKTRFQVQRLKKRTAPEEQLTVSWEKEHDSTRKHILSAKKPLTCFQCFKKYSDYNGVKRHFKTSHLMDCKCNFCDLSVLHEMHLWQHAQDVHHLKTWYLSSTIPGLEFLNISTIHIYFEPIGWELFFTLPGPWGPRSKAQNSQPRILRFSVTG